MLRAFVTILMCSLSLVTLFDTPAHADERVREGFYARLMFGGGYFYSTVATDPGDADVSVTGPGIGGFVMVGTTLGKNWVVGGGALGFHILSPTLTVDGADSDNDSDIIGLTVGPFVDYYPDPRSGLHFFALAGVATMDDGNDATSLSVGVGGALGGGYDVFVSDEWSVGVVARLQVMQTYTSTEMPGADYTYTSLVPLVKLSAVYY